MKAALITGASRGVGRAVAFALAKSGRYPALVLVCRHDDGRLETLAEELLAINPELTCVVSSGDIGNYYYVEKLYDKVRSAGCSVELLINNAAVSYTGLLTDMTRDEWNESISVNLNSLYNTCHTFVPDMIQKRFGTIINVSSVWGLVGASCEVAYSATKGAVNSFTKALAKELAPSGIRVNAIALGIVDTEMNSHLSDEDKQSICEDVPIGHMASAEDAAEAILKLADMPDYLTGSVIKFDGGWI